MVCCRYGDSARALADETRQAIVELLVGREVNVGEIAAHFDLSQPTISYHLALLPVVLLVFLIMAATLHHSSRVLGSK